MKTWEKNDLKLQLNIHYAMCFEALQPLYCTFSVTAGVFPHPLLNLGKALSIVFAFLERLHTLCILHII